MNINQFRPQNFDEFKGKENIKNNLNIFIQSSLNNNTKLDNILLHGLPGTGKTSIAYIVANLLNKKLKIIQGSQLRKNPDLFNFLSLICSNDVVFIDEIHAIGQECFETLYSIIEDGTIDIKIGKENNAKYTRIKMPEFTLIAATTNIGKIPKPLEERFGISFYFGLYHDDEIIEIIKSRCKDLNLVLNDQEIELICNHSKGTPRVAIKLLKRIFDFKTIEPDMEIKQILKQIGSYSLGLETIDFIYLKAFEKGEYLGIKTIASITELDLYTIENKIEPFLIRNNLIIKTPKGRMLTKEAQKILNNLYQEIN